jgi:tyrosine-protein phosphatase SIW14
MALLKRLIVIGFFAATLCYASDSQTALRARSNFAASASADLKQLPNFHQVNANLFRGAQPKSGGYAALKKMGIATILDLRDSDDNALKEKRAAEAAGLRFINIPLSNIRTPKDSDIAEAIRQIDSKDNQPVFVHCSRGADRTGTVIAVYRMTHDGWTDDQAIAEAKQMGLGWWQLWMKDYVRNYYRRYKGK